MIELPGVREDGMLGRNGQRKPRTTRGSPRRSRTAKALRISCHAVKSRWIEREVVRQTVLILHLILLPVNSLRLREMLQLTKQVREAAQGDPNMNWLKPFTSTRHVKAGEVVFHKGEVASDMFVVLSGHFRLVETGIEIVSPHVVGEFALLTPEHSRTQTLECVEAGILLQISYGQIEQLFFQNPKFGFYFLQLITRRLLQNTARLETELAQCRKMLAA